MISKKLIYHPLPYHDEGLQGFVMRLAEGNHLPQTRYLWGKNQITMETLADYLGLDDRITLDRLEQQLNHLGSRPVWNRKYGRACPLCLRQKGYWRQYWELSLASTCPEHGVTLLEECHSCGAPISWQRPNLLNCSCGVKYTEMLTEEATTVEIRANQLLCDSLRKKSSFNADIEQLSLYQLHRLMLMLGVYAQSDGEIAELRKKTISRLEHVIPLMRAAAIVLLDWPKGFYAMLDQIQDRRAALGTQSLDKRFGRFYSHLFLNFKDPEFGFLLNGFEKYLERSWKHALVGRNKRLSVYTRNRHMWVPVKTIAKDLGCGVKALHGLIEDGLIESSHVTTAKGRNIVCINRQQLKKIADLVNDRIDLKTAAHLLNIPEDRMRQLVNHDLMSKVLFTPTRRKRKWHISNSAIRDILILETGLNVLSDLDPEVDITLNEAFQFLLHRNYLFPRLLVDMIKMDFSPKGTLQEVDGLSGWVYEKQQLQQWISEMIKGERKGAFSIPQLALELNIKEQVAYVLTAIGIIECIQESDTHHRIVKPEAVEQFRKTFVFARDLAKDYGTTSRAVIARLESLNIEPVNNTFEMACRQYLFERSKIPSEIFAEM